MSSEKKPEPTPPKRPGADKAEFTVKEKPVKRETTPELEAELQAAGKAGRGGPAPAKEAQPPPQAEIPQFQFTDIAPMLDMAGGKWNEYIAGPTIADEKQRYLWTGEDTKNITTALQLLDNKYHFSANWMQYWPEVFSLIVIGGVIAKLVMGARWKDRQKKEEAAQAEHPAPGPSQSVQPASGKPASEKTPSELAREAEETLKKFNVPA